MPKGAFFIFPISTDPFQLPVEVPEIGLPRLTGYLHAQGLKAQQQDWNAEFWLDYLLSLPAGSYHRIERARRTMPPREGIPDTGKFFHEDCFADAEKNRRYALVRWWMARDMPLRFDVATVAALTAQENTPRDHFHRIKIEQALVPADPAVVGLSIITVHQLAPAFRLADQIRRVLPHVHVVAGGPYFKSGREFLKDYPIFFEHFDSIVPTDGEDAAARLVDAVESGRSLADVPNLVWRDGDGIHVNKATAPLPLSALPAPEFDGYPLDLYFSRALPLQRASRCYWGRCTFCMHNYPGVKLSFLKPPAVVEQMDLLHRRHGTRDFVFIDNCVPGPMMRELARLLRERPANRYTWVQNSRFEQEFIDPEFCRELYEGGCRVLLFGLETIAERSLDNLAKGRRHEAIAQMLANCRAAGLEPALYILVYPGESTEEMERTWAFCIDHKESIGSVIPQRFSLTANCIVYHRPDIVGIEVDSKARDNLDFFHLDYSASQEISAAEFEAQAEALSRHMRASGARSGRFAGGGADPVPSQA